MRYTHFLFGCLFLLFSLPPASAQPAEQASAWAEDIDYLHQTLEARHIDLYHQVSREALGADLDRIKKQLPQLTQPQILVALMGAIKQVGDGHTQLSYWGGAHHRFALQLQMFGEDMRVIGTDQRNASLLGMRLHSVDNIALTEISERLRPILTSVENRHSEQHQLATTLPVAEVLNGLGIIQDIEQAQFTFSDDAGNLHHRQLNSLPSDQADEVMSETLSTELPTGFGLHSASLEGLELYLNPARATAYIRFDRYPQYPHMEKFARSLRDEFASKGIKNLVIDFRNNGGGDFFVGLTLAWGLILIDELNWRNGIYVLTGPKTFSAAMSNSAQFRQLLNARLIGEPTGANPVGYQDADTFKLPNSGWTVMYSKRLYRFQDADTQGVQPDVLIAPDWESFKQKKDNQLMWVMEQIAINYADKDAGKNPELPLYIDNVHILDIKAGQVFQNRQIQIRKGKISAIKPANTPITEAQYILHDGKGQFATPGLIDMHVHAYDPAIFPIALSHGVTHLRIMNGVKEHLTWRQELADGTRIGSTLTLSSPTISGFKNPYMHYAAHTSEDATNAVQKAKQQGYDLIKAYGNLTAPVLKALLSEAKKQNIPVAKHGPHPTADMDWNDLAGLQSLEHVEDIYQGPLNRSQDQSKLDETIQILKELDIPITATLNIFWQLTQISEQKQAYIDTLPKGYISPIIVLEAKHNQVKRWLKSSREMVEHNKKTLAFLQEITRQLHEAEVTLLVGSDSGELLSPHGLATHTEMALMHEAGLPHIAVLRAATLNAAEALGKQSQLGQVAVGFNADLVLTQKNPLKNLAALKDPVAVIKNGRVFSRADLENLRNTAIKNRSFWQEMQTLRNAGQLR